MAMEVRPNHEDAFACYMGDGQRSLKAVSALLKIPAGTVNFWCTKHQWVARAKIEDEERAARVQAHSQSWLDRNRITWLANLNKLANESDDERVRLEANKHLIALSGLIPITRTQVQLQAAPATRDVKELATMTDEELDAELQAGMATG